MPVGRLLCLTSNFPRWAGDSTTPFVLRLNQDLQALGWQVTVLAPHAPGAQSHEVLEGVEVHRFRYLPARLETVCYQGGALINLRKNRANYAKLPALIGSQWLHTLLHLCRGRFDLVHSHWLLPQGFVGVLSAPPFGIPLVCTVHGGDVFGLKGAWLERFKAYTIRHADAVTVNSSATRAAVTAICPGQTALHTIPMGVATDTTSPEATRQGQAIRAQYRRAQGPLLLFIGRLVEEKGLPDLLAALALLRHEHAAMTLVVVGDGQDREALTRLALEQGLADRVFFQGWVADDQIPAYLAAADIFAAPSRTAVDGWVEAQGLTIIEAMMAGRPVVATRTGGIVDSIRDEHSGLLVDERQPQALAQAIDRLVKDPGLARRLGERGRETATSTFSRATSAAAFSGLFSALIAKQGRR